MKFRMKRMKMAVIYLISILLLCGCSRPIILETVTATPGVTTPAGDLKVHFLDVGEGNAVLVESAGRYMLVDGGVNAQSSYVVSYLKKQGIETFDYVVATHYDADHLAGLVGVLHVFTVDRVLGPDYCADTKIYRSFMEQINVQGKQLIYPDVGERYELGDAAFTIIGPLRYGHQDENDDSIAIRVTYGETSFLLAGDAGAESEAEIQSQGINLQSDVYLVNHHGSETSTTQSFLDAVNPTYAVISSSTKGNRYGHPKASVLQRLQRQEVALFRTDLQGEILATSDGRQISFDQLPCNDFSAGEEQIEHSDSEDQNTLLYDRVEVGAEYYVLNSNSNKFHLPTCQAVQQMKETNKVYSEESREQILAQGYAPCGWCTP